jgi:hypothetical protein
MDSLTVSGVLRRFLPDYLRERRPVTPAQRRAIFAITHCRTAVMGGHVHVCGDCGTREFAYHSCNHRSCPQCGRGATFEWVQRELGKRIGAPYYMVTFTLPEDLRALFFSKAAPDVHHVFFTAASRALAAALAGPRWLGAATSGFTMVLHTWNQRLLFHPHLHCIVPGAGLDARGRIVVVKNENFLVPQPVLRRAFRERFRALLGELAAKDPDLPAVDGAVWEKDWGVHLQPFGGGERAIQYLGAYVSRTAIGDSRIVGVEGDRVMFRWKDRANGGAPRIETLTGVEFIRRYLRHVLPRGMKAIRHYGFCHPAAKASRAIIAAALGTALPPAPADTPPVPPRTCPCCGLSMSIVVRLLPARRLTGQEAPFAARPPPTLAAARSCA